MKKNDLSKRPRIRLTRPVLGILAITCAIGGLAYHYGDALRPEERSPHQDVRMTIAADMNPPTYNRDGSVHHYQRAALDSLIAQSR